LPELNRKEVATVSDALVIICLGRQESSGDFSLSGPPVIPVKLRPMAYFVFDGHGFPQSIETCPAKIPDRIIVTHTGSLSGRVGSYVSPRTVDSKKRVAVGTRQLSQTAFS
jgi:hypothetical protein